MLLVGGDFATPEAVNEGEGVLDAHHTDLVAIETGSESLLKRSLQRVELRRDTSIPSGLPDGGSIRVAVAFQGPFEAAD